MPQAAVASRFAAAPAPRALARAAVTPGSRWTLLLVALCGVILQYVWRIQEMFTPLRYVQFTALVSLGAVVLFVLHPEMSRRLHLLRHPLYRLILWIFVLAVLSVPASIRIGDSIRFLTGNFGKTVLQVGIIVACVRDRRDIDRLLRVFVIGGALYVCASILFAPPTGGRLGGGSYDPNDLGLFTVCSIPLCVYQMRRRAGLADRIAGLVTVALLLAATVLSGSRGGFLALLAVGLYGLFALKAVRFSKRVTVTTFALAAMFIAAGSGYWDRISTILKPQEDYNWEGHAESGRMEVWKRGLGYMADRPVFGVGVDQFDVAEGTLSVLSARQVGLKWSAAHNSYVQIGAEIGAPALAVFIWMLFTAYRTARRIGRGSAMPDDRLLGQCFAALVVGYAIGCTFLSQAYSTYLYFALGILIALSRHAVPRPRRSTVVNGLVSRAPGVSQTLNAPQSAANLGWQRAR